MGAVPPPKENSKTRTSLEKAKLGLNMASREKQYSFCFYFVMFSVYLCASMCVGTDVCMHECTCMWKPEADEKCLSQTFL